MFPAQSITSEKAGDNGTADNYIPYLFFLFNTSLEQIFVRSIRNPKEQEAPYKQVPGTTTPGWIRTQTQALAPAGYLHLTGTCDGFCTHWNTPTVEWTNFRHPAYEAGFLPPNKVFLLWKIAAWSELLLPEQLNKVWGRFIYWKIRIKTKTQPNQWTVLLSHPYHKSKNTPACVQHLAGFQPASQVSWALWCPYQVSNAAGSAPFLPKQKPPVLVQFWKVSSSMQGGGLKALLCNTVLQGTIRGSTNSSSSMMKIDNR